MTTQLQTVLDALEQLAQALPVERSTIKTCYAINDHHRDSVHKSLAIVRQMMQAEPVAWSVYVAEADNQYIVDDIDDPQLIDDCTNHNAEVTPLFTAPQAVPAVAAFRDEVFAVFKRMGMSEVYPLWVAVEAIGTETVTDPAAIRAAFEEDDYSDIVSDGGFDPRNAAAPAVKETK
jgi:hypothetical protein